MNNNLNAGVRPANAVNPLLLNYTPKTRIQEETVPFLPLYDDEKQIVYDTRTIGTKCMKSSNTKKKGVVQTMDRKNEIDDSKNVK
jgi:hypothetical protein